MKKLLPLSILILIFNLTSCRNEPEVKISKSANKLPVNATKVEEAFPGEVGMKKSGFLFGQKIEYSEIQGKIVFEGDLVLSKEDVSQYQNIKNGRTEGTARQLRATRWPNNIVYFTISPNLPNNLRVRDAITHWESNTSLTFVERTNQENFITFIPANGCYSDALGMRGGEQFIGLADGCTTGNTIHEIGHAIGLFHEQSRADRDNFITVNYGNIIPDATHNFNTYFQNNIDGFETGTLDFGSIMMYDSYAFSSNNLPTIVRTDGSTFTSQRNALSTGDLFMIKNIYGIFSAIESWTSNSFYGSIGTYFTDVTGDGKSDAIAVNENGIYIKRSNGVGFQSTESWTSNGFYGSKGTFLTDVTGDGKADAVVVNEDGIYIKRSNGNGFSTIETWSSTAFFGSIGTYFSDVNGDGKSDVIVVNGDGVYIRRSNGNSFLATENWITGSFYGAKGTFFEDVTGDGKTDAIAVNENGIKVRRSTGNNFHITIENWTSSAFYGSIGTYFVDVTGDRKADAIAVNEDGVIIKRATDSDFYVNETGTGLPYFGSNGTAFADLNGDKKADAIVINIDGITIRKSEY